MKGYVKYILVVLMCLFATLNVYGNDFEVVGKLKDGKVVNEEPKYMLLLEKGSDTVVMVLLGSDYDDNEYELIGYVNSDRETTFMLDKYKSNVTVESKESIETMSKEELVSTLIDIKLYIGVILCICFMLILAFVFIYLLEGEAAYLSGSVAAGIIFLLAIVGYIIYF